MTLRALWMPGACAALFLVYGCGDEGGGAPRPQSSFAAIIGISQLAHDVTGVRFSIVAADATCGATPLVNRSVPLDGDLLAGSTQRFASTVFVLPPGSYRICAAPLAVEAPSAECQPTEGVATVSDDQTSDVLLISQCAGAPGGGLSTIVALNDPPTIETITLDPAQRISVCESLALSIAASDPNGDALSYGFAVEPGPGTPQLTQGGSSARFWGAAGDYVIAVTVTDAHGASTALRVPIGVSDATCATPQAVQSIFSARCAPCHTTSMSGGLRLEPATTSYASLVNVKVRAAACASGLLVAPQDPANSYLIAKLRAAPGICGMPMPRNAPPLPEAEIATIEAWIAALPK